MNNPTLCIKADIDAPLEKVWLVWTKPEHLTQWWGPAGFTTTIHQMEMVVGSEWKLTLHSPDGTNFPNRSIFREIISHKKIVYEHFNPHFIATVVFEEQGKETSIDWSMEFDTVEMYEVVVKTHKADEGQKQNIEKLKAYLKKLQ